MLAKLRKCVSRRTDAAQLLKRNSSRSVRWAATLAVLKRLQADPAVRETLKRSGRSVVLGSTHVHTLFGKIPRETDSESWTLWLDHKGLKVTSFESDGTVPRTIRRVSFDPRIPSLLTYTLRENAWAQSLDPKELAAILARLRRGDLSVDSFS